MTIASHLTSKSPLQIQVKLLLHHKRQTNHNRETQGKLVQQDKRQVNNHRKTQGKRNRMANNKQVAITEQKSTIAGRMKQQSPIKPTQ